MKSGLKKVIDQMARGETPFKDAVSWFKEKYLKKALEIHEGDPSRAAKALGMKKDAFRRKMSKYNLKPAKKAARKAG